MKKQNNPKLTRKLFSILTSLMLMVNGLSIGAFAEAEGDTVRNNTTTADGVYTNALDKKAEATTVEDEFEVTIKVEGKENPVLKPMDIVFVLDASGSMNTGDKLNQAKAAITNFMNALVPGTTSNTSIRFGLVTFAEDVWTANVQGLTYQKSDIAGKYPSSAKNGTHIQAGLERAKTMLDTDLGTAAPTNRYIILVSDGAPTYSNKVTGLVNTQSPAIQRYATGDSGNYGVYRGTSFGSRVGSGSDFKLSQYEVNFDKNTKVKVFDHGFATISSAINIRQSYQIFGIGVGYVTDYNITAANSEKVLTDIASPSSVYTVANASQLHGVLQGIATTLQGTIVNGTLLDPMSQYVDVVDKDSSGAIDAGDYTITPYQVGSAGMPGTPTVNYNITTNAFEITNINLGAGQGFTFAYTVKMKPEYHTNTFHKLNDPTTLYPTGEDDPAINIEVPEGKVPAPPVIQEPSVQLIKTATPGFYQQIGDEITYSFTVTNNGNTTLYGVTINDPMLGGTINVTPSTLDRET